MNTKQPTQAELTQQLLQQMIKKTAENTEALYELAKQVENLTSGDFHGGTLVDAINELALSNQNKK